MSVTVKLARIVFAVVLAFASSACQQAGFVGRSVRGLDGRWEGTLNLPGEQYSLVWELAKSETGYGGTIEVSGGGHSQGYYVQLARIRGREVEVIASFGGLGSLTFVGQLSGNSIKGKVSGHAVGDPVSGEFQVRK